MPIIVDPVVNPASTALTDRLFLNDAEDPSDFETFQFVDAYTPELILGGGVDSDYASGRSRAWTDESDVTTIAVTLLWLTPMQTAWLVSHRGRTVCLRDPRGRKVFGVYFSTPISVAMYSEDADSVDLTLTSVTFSEAV